MHQKKANAEMLCKISFFLLRSDYLVVWATVIIIIIIIIVVVIINLLFVDVEIVTVPNKLIKANFIR